MSDNTTNSNDLPDQQSPAGPDQIPPDMLRAIQMHQAGSGMKLMYVHPQLAEDLAQIYSSQNLVVAHDPAIHGDLGASAQEVGAHRGGPGGNRPSEETIKKYQQQGGPNVEVPTTAAPPPVMKEDPIAKPPPPITPTELPSGPKVEINDQPGQQKTYDRNLIVGPGVRFDGKNYQYWNGAKWVAANIGPLQAGQATPPGISG